jgi:methylase of polypeptide subunit release factors
MVGLTGQPVCLHLLLADRQAERAAFAPADFQRLHMPVESAAVAQLQGGGPFDLVLCNPPYLRRDIMITIRTRWID